MVVQEIQYVQVGRKEEAENESVLDNNYYCWLEMPAELIISRTALRLSAYSRDVSIFEEAQYVAYSHMHMYILLC